MQIIESAMQRSRTVIMSLAVIIVAGVITYANVPKEAEPDLDIPVVYISMKHDGISPEDAERLLIQKALDKSEGNVSLAAEDLGLSRSALYRRLEKHGLN